MSLGIIFQNKAFETCGSKPWYGEDIVMQFTSIDIAMRSQILRGTILSRNEKEQALLMPVYRLQKVASLGLVGTNGAGKTTLLRMIAEFYRLRMDTFPETTKILILKLCEPLSVLCRNKFVGQANKRFVRLDQVCTSTGCSIQSATNVLDVVGLKNRIDVSLDSLSQDEATAFLRHCIAWFA